MVQRVVAAAGGGVEHVHAEDVAVVEGEDEIRLGGLQLRNQVRCVGGCWAEHRDAMLMGEVGQMFSLSPSSWVRTRLIWILWASRTDRQRTPTLWLANTTAVAME